MDELAAKGKLDVLLGASTLAVIEVAMSKGYEIAALVLTRASPSRESYKTLFVANTAADPEVTASFTVSRKVRRTGAGNEEG